MMNGIGNQMKRNMGRPLFSGTIKKLIPETIHVVKRLLKDTGAFQHMAILHEDRVTGMRDGLRDFGQQIEAI
jgi:hypothetical protein